MKSSIGCVMALALMAFVAIPAGAQTTGEPVFHVCTVSYSEPAKEARYRLTVDWGGLPRDRYHRIDVGARDASDATWPQFRDQRLKPRGKPTNHIFVVSRSLYPLDLFLLGFTAGAAREFDEACDKSGFCALRLPTEGVDEFGTGPSIINPGENPCPNE